MIVQRAPMYRIIGLALLVVGVTAGPTTSAIGGVGGEGQRRRERVVVVADVAPWGGLAMFDDGGSGLGLGSEWLPKEGLPPRFEAVAVDSAGGRLFVAAVRYGDKAQPDTTWIGRYGPDGLLEAALQLQMAPAGSVGGMAIDRGRQQIYLTNSLNAYIYTLPLELESSLRQGAPEVLEPIGSVRQADELGPIAIDRLTSRLFVGDSFSGDIYAVPLNEDGTQLGYEFETILPEVGELGGMVFDEADRRLYVLELLDFEIWRVTLRDEGDPEAEVLAGLDEYGEYTPLSISTEAEALLWTVDRSEGAAISVGADGELREPVPLGDRQSPGFPSEWDPSFDVNYRLATEAIRAGEWAEAERHLRAAIREEPDDAAAEPLTFGQTQVDYLPALQLVIVRALGGDCDGALRAQEVAADRGERGDAEMTSAVRDALRGCG